MKKRRFITSLLLFLSFFFAPQALGTTKAATCKDKSPTSAPILTSAIAGSDNVTLTWTEAQDPLTYYLVAYGRTATEIEYGSPNVGGRGTTSFVVGKLTRGVKYYFKVRAVNGCKPGKFSNKLSATPGVLRNVTKTPNLSIYKTVQGDSTSAAIPALPEMSTKSFSETDSILPFRCIRGISWQLLIVEAILLISCLYIAKKTNSLVQIYSAVIPIVIYVLHSKVNQGCTLGGFTDKFFLPLEIIVYIATIIVYKRMCFDSHYNSIGDRKKGR